MKMTVLIFLFCLAAPLLHGQTRLAGQVTLQNSGNQSAHPAQVRSYGATDTDVRSEDGSFDLIYDRKMPGQMVELEAVKPGYEVVNRQDLRWMLPANPLTQRRLKLYLCPQGQWREYASRFYEINYHTVIANYQRALDKAKSDLAAAAITGEAYRQKLEQLEKDRDFSLREAERLSELFAKANLDDASERFYQAYQYFSRGLIDSVLIVLQEDEMLEDLYRAEREMEEAIYLIGIGEQMAREGGALKALIEEVKLWKDSLEREGFNRYCIRLLPDPAALPGPDYPALEGGVLRVWFMRHRPASVSLTDSCAVLDFVRRSYSFKSFRATLEAKYWSLSKPFLSLTADTLVLAVRPDGSLGRLNGRVADGATGAPLPNVRVACEGESTVTDEKGRFELHIPAIRQKRVYRLQFTKSGKPPAERTMEPDSQPFLEVRLY